MSFGVLEEWKKLALTISLGYPSWANILYVDVGKDNPCISY